MSNRHRGVPQIHINSAESKMHPSNVEQVLRRGLLRTPRILNAENRQGLQYTRGWQEAQERDPGQSQGQAAIGTHWD